MTYYTDLGYAFLFLEYDALVKSSHQVKSSHLNNGVL